MASVVENLKAAKALIDTPEKWGKGAFEFRGCYCALGALGMAEAGTPAGYSLTGRWALQCALPNTFLSVDAFNDHPDTTHADIMALFERAIAAEEAKEAA